MRGLWRWWGSRKEGFFFEKKKQKTFALALLLLGALVSAGAEPNEQKFFGSFFQKKNILSFARYICFIGQQALLLQ